MSAERLLPQEMDRDAPIFTISVAARLADLHAQTLRTYDRMGLVVPHRTRGGGRRYSLRNIARLRLIQHLSQEEGVNLEGIRRILAMQDTIDDLTEQVAALEEKLAEQMSAPDPSRFFTADTSGAVHLGAWAAARRRPRQITAD